MTLILEVLPVFIKWSKRFPVYLDIYEYVHIFSRISESYLKYFTLTIYLAFVNTFQRKPTSPVNKYTLDGIL